METKYKEIMRGNFLIFITEKNYFHQLTFSKN